MMELIVKEKKLAMERSHSYVLVTPARNEGDFIEKTLKSVVDQTLRPIGWAIVSDGSTDRTDEIVKHFAKQNPFIKFVRLDRFGDRDFRSKVAAFNAGYERIKHLPYRFIGILDADVSCASDYYERILEKFEHDKTLGVAGGLRFDLQRGIFEKVICANDSVGGPFQLFRRECFEDTGGFIPQALGGEDAVIEIMARMHGWKVRHFKYIHVYHYRWTGTASFGIYRSSYREGIKNYQLGYTPIFQIAKSIYRYRQRPYFIGSILMLIGYCIAHAKRLPQKLPDSFLSYFKHEQKIRLRNYVTRLG